MTLQAFAIAVVLMSSLFYLVEQPYYINKTYTFWNGFQDYTSVYPITLHMIQIFQKGNITMGNMVPRTIAGQLISVLSQMMGVYFVGIFCNTMIYYQNLNIAQVKTQYMIQNEDTRVVYNK